MEHFNQSNPIGCGMCIWPCCQRLKERSFFFSFSFIDIDVSKYRENRLGKRGGWHRIQVQTWTGILDISYKMHLLGCWGTRRHSKYTKLLLQQEPSLQENVSVEILFSPAFRTSYIKYSILVTAQEVNELIRAYVVCHLTESLFTRIVSIIDCVFNKICLSVA